MKRLKRRVAVLLSTLFVSALLPTAAYASGRTAVTTDNLNFREEGSVSGAVMAVIPSGSEVEVLDTEGKWVQVNFEGQIGWVFQDFIVDAEAVTLSKKITNLSETELKAEADSKSETLEVLAAGSVVELKALAGDWYEVILKDQTGFVKAKGWVDAPTESKAVSQNETPREGKYELFNDTTVYMNAYDAGSSMNPVGTYKAGEYLIYKNFSGMINITRFKDIPGAWINPETNIDTPPPAESPETPPENEADPSDPTVPGIYEATVTLDTYLTAEDAAAGTDAVGRYEAGTYFIFREYGGMVNLAKTEGTPGAWVNPKQAGLEVPPAETADIIVSNSYVNMRESADNGSPIVTKVPTGTEAVLKGIEGNWLKVEYEGQTGYSHKDYWDVSDELVAKFTKPQENPNTIVSNASVNIREGAGSSFRILKTIPEGSKAVMTGKEGGWLRIDYEGQIGYSYLSYWNVPDQVMNKFAGDDDEPKANGYKVYLDPGHMGTGQGASAVHDGKRIDENTINYRVAVLTKDFLESKGYTVYISKKHPEDPVGLSERTSQANELKADIFVSIHTNAFSDPSVKGTIGFWASQKNNPNTQDWQARSKLLSQILANRVGNVIGASKAVNESSYGISYSVNRKSNMPSTLLEMGFITNYHDAIIMDSSASQKDLAREIANGIDEYFKK